MSAAPGAPLVELGGVGKAYRTGEVEVPVLHGVSLPEDSKAAASALLNIYGMGPAFEALAGGLGRTYEARYQGATDLLRSDLRLAAMA